jgi:hypothetical protein
MVMSLRRIALLALAGAAVLPATASADEALTTILAPTTVHSDGGVTAWRIHTSGDDRLVVRYGTDTPFTTAFPIPRETIMDVGVSPAGGARVAFARNCSSRRRTCELRVVELGRSGSEGKKLGSRLLTRIPYRGGGAPAVAVDKRQIAWTQRDRGCDIPYTRRTGSSPTGAKRLDRGHCAEIEQLDLDGTRIAVLAHEKPDTRESEARLLRTSGGKSRRIQRETQGEESNFIGQVALDGPYLYTARGGIRQANVFTRFNLHFSLRADARAFTSLAGGFAVERGRVTYVETNAGFGGCRSDAGTACAMVDGGDPFVGTRLLTPRLTFDIAPAPLFVDQGAQGVGRLARKRVSRTADLGSVPVAGVKVELVRVDGFTTPAPSRHPTGVTATTGADGRYAMAIGGTPRPRMTYTAITRPTSGVQVNPGDITYVLTYVRMTAAPQRLPDGRLRVTGTITPAQPGRKVRLDRREERVCNAQVFTARPTPSTVDTPAGCADRYTQNPIATANVSADGASFTVDASTGPGTFRVDLDFAGGADVYQGETAPFSG